MLETNNPYMFGSSTTTTTATTAAPNQSSPVPPHTSSSSLGGNSSALNSGNQMQQSRPMHHHSSNYYIGKGGEDEYYHNHQHSSRINPTYARHPEEPSQQQSLQQQQPIHYTSTYKPTKSINQNTNNIAHQQHNEPDKLNNFMRPSVHVYPHQQQHIKREASPNMLPAPPPPPPSFMKSRKAVDEPDWYERENKSHRPTAPSSIIPAIIPSTANTTTTTTTLSSTAPSSGEVSTLEAGDNKKIKRRKEMTGIMEDLNKDFLKKKEK